MNAAELRRQGRLPVPGTGNGEHKASIIPQKPSPIRVKRAKPTPNVAQENAKPRAGGHADRKSVPWPGPLAGNPQRRGTERCLLAKATSRRRQRREAVRPAPALGDPCRRGPLARQGKLPIVRPRVAVSGPQ